MTVDYFYYNKKSPGNVSKLHPERDQKVCSCGTMYIIK